MGVAVWCAAGSLAPLDSQSWGVRLAVLASPWWLVGGAGLAALVPAFRQTPSTAAPALVATLPWWPVAWPASILIWTGKLAWLPIGLACFAALFRNDSPGSATRIEAESRPSPDCPPSPDRAPSGPILAAGLCTLALAAATAWSVAPRVPGGDELHYLVITQSLQLDADLRIENNHARADYRAYFDGTLQPDYLRRGRDDEIYSVHAPGVALLVLPLFALFGYGGAQVTIVLLAAMAGGVIWWSGWLATGDRASAWFAWAALVTTVTFLVQGVTVFPDGPAMLGTAVGLALILRLRQRPRAVSRLVLVTGSAGLALLPWLHTRFAVLSVMLGGLVVGLLAADEARTRRTRIARAAAFLALPACSAIAWFGFFQWIYGTPNPTAPYGANPETSVSYVPGGVLALLADQQFGLLVYAPVLALALVTWLRRPRPETGEPLRGAGVVAVVYAASVATYWMWWAGIPAPPARLLTAALPLAAPALAVGWRRASPVARAFWAMLLAISAGTSVVLVGVERGALAWNARDSWSAVLEWLASAANLPRAWPSFFWDLDPGVAASEMPFAGHALAWLVLFGVSGWAVVRSEARWSERVHPAVAAAGWWLVTMTAAAELGWRLTGAAPLEPGRRQLSVLSRSAADAAAVVRIAPLSVTGGGDRLADLRVAFPRADLARSSTAAWRALRDVPPGRYELRVRSRQAAGTRLSLQLGNSPTAYRSWALEARLDQQLPFELAAGADTLSLTAEGPLAASDPKVDLVPLAVREGSDRATARVSFGPVEAYLLDRSAFAEADAFWVAGGESSELMLVWEEGSPHSLELSNGPVANPVILQAGDREIAASLEPGGRTVVALPYAGGSVARVRITSPAGFRPSDHDPASGDRRVLGVRVRVVDP